MYTYTNSKGVTYHLNEKEVLLRSKKIIKLRYFSKEQRDTACELPAGYKVVESQRTGLPVLKKDV